jgi:hypothetical protein
VDWHAGWEAIEQGATPAVIVDSYLVVYEVGSPWYVTAPLLLEQLVLRLDPTPGNYSSVLNALDALATHHKCVGVVAGNSVGRRALTRAYERGGYTVAAIQLIKEKK